MRPRKSLQRFATSFTGSPMMYYQAVAGSIRRVSSLRRYSRRFRLSARLPCSRALQFGHCCARRGTAPSSRAPGPGPEPVGVEFAGHRGRQCPNCRALLHQDRYFGLFGIYLLYNSKRGQRELPAACSGCALLRGLSFELNIFLNKQKLVLGQLFLEIFPRYLPQLFTQDGGPVVLSSPVGRKHVQVVGPCCPQGVLIGSLRCLETQRSSAPPDLMGRALTLTKGAKEQECNSI